VIAALFLFAIKKTIVFKEDKMAASYRWVPVYVAVMAWAFVTYLVLKGLKKIWPQMLNLVNDVFFFTVEVSKKPSFMTAALIGGLVAILVYNIVKKRLRSKLKRLDNTRKSVNVLFTIPLIFAASLLSFAHGANDVANAIGPLAAINDAVMTGGISAKADIPFWVMAVGAFGLAIGLALYGPRLIKTVGSGITDLDPIRAFSVAMAAAITVIIASQLGLPVSSTHIAIGGIFGVGLLREWLDKTSTLEAEIAREKALVKGEKERLRGLYDKLNAIEAKSDRAPADSQEMLRIYKLIDEERVVIKAAKKELKKDQKSLYIKQGMIQKIITAWLITVPSAAVLSACIYYIIESLMT
jgi:PiT family inorganic phosphate transporter